MQVQPLNQAVPPQISRQRNSSLENGCRHGRRGSSLTKTTRSSRWLSLPLQDSAPFRCPAWPPLRQSTAASTLCRTSRRGNGRRPSD